MPIPLKVPAHDARLVVTAKVVRAQVVAAHAGGVRIESPRGRGLSDLACPICHKWLGDPDNPEITRVSQTAGEHRAECRRRRKRPANGP